MTCFNCNGIGHRARDCPEAEADGESHPRKLRSHGGKSQEDGAAGAVYASIGAAASAKFPTGGECLTCKDDPPFAGDDDTGLKRFPFSACDGPHICSVGTAPKDEISAAASRAIGAAASDGKDCKPMDLREAKYQNAFAHGQACFDEKKGTLVLWDSGANQSLAKKSCLSNVRPATPLKVTLGDGHVNVLDQAGDLRFEARLHDGKAVELEISGVYACSTPIPIISASALDESGIELDRLRRGPARGPCVSFREASKGSITGVLPLTKNYTGYLMPLDPEVLEACREEAAASGIAAVSAVKSAVLQEGMGRVRRVRFAEELAHVVTYPIRRGASLRKSCKDLYRKRGCLSKSKLDVSAIRLQAALERARNLEAELGATKKAAAAAAAMSEAAASPAATAPVTEPAQLQARSAAQEAGDQGNVPARPLRK